MRLLQNIGEPAHQTACETVRILYHRAYERYAPHSECPLKSIIWRFWLISCFPFICNIHVSLTSHKEFEMKKLVKTIAGFIGLCALYAASAVADDIAVVVSTDDSGQGRLAEYLRDLLQRRSMGPAYRLPGISRSARISRATMKASTRSLAFPTLTP